MEEVKFIFDVDGIKTEKVMIYPKKPSRMQIENDMKEWFFENHYMWFSFEMNGKITNLDD